MIVPLAIALLVNEFWSPELATILLLGICAGEVARREGIIPLGIVPYVAIFCALVALGIIGGYGEPVHDVIRDCWYFTNPCIGFVVGYLLVRSGKRLGSVMSTFIIVGFVAAVVHLTRLIFVVVAGEAGSIIRVRDIVGPGYFAAAVAMAIWLAMGPAGNVLPKWLRNGVLNYSIAAIALSSVVLSFSRTLWLCVAIAVVVIVPRTWSARRSRLIAGIFAMVLVVFGLVWINTTDTRFSEKIVDTVAELGTVDFTTRSEIGRYWRAFESIAALQTYAAADATQQMFGYGFGKQIDLGISMELAGATYDEIPILHNGYLYALVKTGVLGLLLVMTLLYMLYRTRVSLPALRDVRARSVENLAQTIVLTTAATTFVVGGIFSSEFGVPAMIVLGGCVSYVHGLMANGRSEYAARLDDRVS